MIGAFSPAALSQLAGAVGGVAGPVVSVTNVYVDMAPVVAALDDIHVVLRGTNSLLVDLHQALTNPSAVAADELYRRGVLAYEHGWLVEARADLEAAVERFPYRPAAQFLLGIVLVELDELTAADTAFAAAVRYGTAAEAEFALQAAITAARLRALAGVPEAGLALLERAWATLPRSGWVAAEIARFRGQLSAEVDVDELSDLDRAALMDGLDEEGRATMGRALAAPFLGVIRALLHRSGRGGELPPNATMEELAAAAGSVDIADLDQPSRRFVEDLALGRLPEQRCRVSFTDVGPPPTTRHFDVVPPAKPATGLRPVGVPAR